MSVYLLEELALEYLSTQYEPVEYSILYSEILDEAGLTDVTLKVDLWLKLYHNRDILILVCDNYNKFNDTFLLRYKKKRSPPNADQSLKYKSNEFESYIDRTKLLCSNSFRIRRMNLVLYGRVVKSYERFHILMRIASKRYNGCWQSDLTLDLGISPKTLFPYLNTLSKLGLIYKLTIPHNRISKYLLSNSGSIKYDLDKGDPLLSGQGVASICFYGKYFVIEKLPNEIKLLCFNDITKLAEDTLISMLENDENNIVLESDWRSAYFDVAMNEINSLSVRIENHVISRSYISLRKSLELKNKIRRTFAWCPQTNKFERCIMSYNDGIDMDKSKFDKTLHVINIKAQNKPTKITVEKIKNKPVPWKFNGHSIYEYVYYIILLSRTNGITAKEIYKILPVKYKQLSKIIANVEDTKLIKKETFRFGKSLMYKYYPKKILKIEGETDYSGGERGEKILDSKQTSPLQLSPDSLKSLEEDDAENISYEDYVRRQQTTYKNESLYMDHFRYLFPSVNLPKQVDTFIFKRRMVLLHKYINYYKASTLSNVASFFTDVEQSSTKVDRKTVLRVFKHVFDTMPWIKMLKSDELRGSNASLTILYDSRKYNDIGAYDYIKTVIARKRNLLSLHSATLKSKINSSFKNLNEVGEDAISLLNREELNVSVSIPCIIKDVTVNQMVTEHGSKLLNVTNSKILTLNGYIYPTVTRLKHLHYHLIDNYYERKFKTSEVVNNFSLELYFQIIGCNHDLSDLKDYEQRLTDKIKDLPKGVVNILSLSKRDPLSILNNLLNILLRMKLLNIHETYNDESYNCTVEWELVKDIELNSFDESNSLVGIYSVKKAEEYWNKLKILVDEYMSMDREELPTNMKIRELFVKKNWKPVLYMNNNTRSGLDSTITLWLKLSYSDMDSKTLLKIIHVPYYVLAFFYDKFKIPHYQIYNFITNKIKVIKNIPSYTEDFNIYNVIKNITRDSEYTWFAKLAISEHLSNTLFYNLYGKGWSNSSADREPRGDKEGKFYSVERDDRRTMKMRDSSSITHTTSIWDFMSVLFDGKYTAKECMYIIDYMINNSPASPRLLKRFRKLNTDEIIKYALKCNLPMLSSGNKRVIFSDHVTNTILKSITFTPTINWSDLFTIDENVKKQFKHIIKEWIDYDWIVKTKKKTLVFGKYKLTNISKAKLFGKYTDLLFYSNLLIQSSNMYQSNYLDANIYTIYNLLESNTKFKCNWIADLVNHTNEHLNNAKTIKVTSVKSNINEFDGEFISERPIPRELICENQNTDILNPLGTTNLHEVNNKYPLQRLIYVNNTIPVVGNLGEVDFSRNVKETIAKINELLSMAFNDNVTYEDLQNALYMMIKFVKDAGSDGVVYSCLSSKFPNVDHLLFVSQLLRFIAMLSTGEEYTFIYWEYSKALYIRKFQVGDRERPEYVSAYLWSLWEETLDVTGNVSGILGRLKTLIGDDKMDDYLSNYKMCNVSVFTCYNGCLNTCLIAFVSMRIYTILRDKPELTLEEVWRELVIFDKCEVEMLLKLLCDVDVIGYKTIKSYTNTLLFNRKIVSDPDNSMDIKLFYAQDTSMVLRKFRHLLLPFVN